MHNEQEAFWKGSFGDAYSARNSSRDLVEANKALFAKAFLQTGEVSSLIEFGANRGLNLQAIHELDPDITLSAVEINDDAAWKLVDLGYVTTHFGSLLKFDPHDMYDMALVKGVLIHLHPDDLPAAYDVIYASSSKYVMIAEYYSETPVSVDYRGHEGKLFKADFGSQFLRRFPDMRLKAKWFAGKETGQDDLTVWIMERT